MKPHPKYALLEIERRWLVDLTKVDALEQCRVRYIEDRYIHDTRLRLRRIEEEGKKPEYKLCKKYGKTGDWAEPITNLYLAENEYLNLAQLPAAVVDKRRYSLSEGGIDVYDLEGVSVFEIEFNTLEEANVYVPPAFVLEEITNVEEYSGYFFATVRK